MSLSCQTVRYMPKLSSAKKTLTYDVEIMDEQGRLSTISIPAERPLALYVNGIELVTLMTLGQAPELLVLGYLRNQRLVSQLEDIVSIDVDWDSNAAHIVLTHPIADLKSRIAKRVITTGCAQGSVFGDVMADIETIRLPSNSRLSQTTVWRVVEQFRSQQSIYKQAGSVHGCSLFDKDGNLLYFVEDVGRHNAVDIISGWMWLEGINGNDKIFYTTGRLTSEMVMKGSQMGIPFLLSRSGATQMGHRIATLVDSTLLTRCSGKHFLVLTGHHHIVIESVMQAIEG
jgi:FdhD protein